MPELPEVEVVRRGVADHVVGARFADVELSGARVARRHLPGPLDLADRLRGRRVWSADRRGKYLWLVVGDADHGDAGDAEALVVHLGMSGQLLVTDAQTPRPPHCHAVFTLDDPARPGRQLRFVDQRTFGGLALTGLAAPQAGHPLGVPASILHIAPDPFEPSFDAGAVAAAMKRTSSAVKRLLLDQRLVSGIGNIYADEALWRAGVHGRRAAQALTRPALTRLLGHARDVMSAALEQGGTSFDALYVNVNGNSGYFDRSLNAYGQAGRPCARCGTPIRREAFMNRSSFSCPRCQVRPRLPA